MGGEGVAALLEVSAAGVGVGSTALHFGQIDQCGLVEVDQAAPLDFDAVQASVEAGQFGGEDFVVGGGGVRGDGLLADGQDIGA